VAKEAYMVKITFTAPPCRCTYGNRQVGYSK